MQITEGDLDTIRSAPGFPVCSLCRRDFTNFGMELARKPGGYLGLAPQDDVADIKEYWLCRQCGRRLGMTE